MPQSKERHREYMRTWRRSGRGSPPLSYDSPRVHNSQIELGTSLLDITGEPSFFVGTLRNADVRALRAIGIDPTAVDWTEEGAKVSPGVLAALRRDRDAIKVHLSWHHDSVTNPDIATIIERVIAHQGDKVGKLSQRVLQLEIERVLETA